MAFDIIYNGVPASSLGLLVYQRPDYKAPEETINTFSVPGRAFDLYQRSGRFGTASIEVTFNYAAERDQWGEVWRKAVRWLRGSGTYIQSDDLRIYRKVEYVKIDTNGRSARAIGKFKATFVCEPGEYYVNGSNYKLLDDLCSDMEWDSGLTAFACTLENKYSKCHPTWVIQADAKTTISVNGNEFVVDPPLAGGYTIIDTDLKLTYGSDGSNLNTSAAGDYDDLMLEPGTSQIESSSGTSAYAVYIKPNWVVI